MGLKGRCAKKSGNDRFARPGGKGREEGQGKRRGEDEGKGSAEGNGK